MASYLHAVDDCDGATAPTAGDGEAAPDIGLRVGVGEHVVIADRYELVGRIGRGATGSVYRAFDRTLDRMVAIKLLHPGELEVGEREAQVLAKVAHRNVVTIHDYGQHAGLRYLVLELLEGRDLRTWLRERPSAREIIENFVEAGRGLAAAHHAGLVHRDFKPSNVIITNPTASAAGRVVVIDFGLARSLDSLGGELEQQRFTEGTLAYMAPERLAGQENDERSDQFAFCVALWEALAGSNPFSGEDPLARYRSIRRGAARVDGSELGGVGRHVVDALERGVSFEREDRFSTMDELLRELERPAITPQQHRNRPVLMAMAVAATFFIGWGLAPESNVANEAHSSFDPTADLALALLDAAHKRAVDGDYNSALNDLMYAAELMNDVERGSDGYCAFGRSLPPFGDLFLEKQATSQAVMAYAIAARFAQSCPREMDFKDLVFRREAAQASTIVQPGNK